MIRRALLLCLVLAVAGAIAGCGSQGASDEGNPEGGASATVGSELASTTKASYRR